MWNNFFFCTIWDRNYVLFSIMDLFYLKASNESWIDYAFFKVQDFKGVCSVIDKHFWSWYLDKKCIDLLNISSRGIIHLLVVR